jgi:galactokinase
MHHSARRLTLLTLSLLGLNSCFTQAPLDEDINQRKAAIAVAEKYMSAIQSTEIEALLDMSKTPYWLDGEIVDQPDKLAKALRKGLSHNEKAKRLQRVNARFYSRADLKIFMPDLLKRFQEKNMQGDYFVILQLTDPTQGGENRGLLFRNGKPEGILFIMQFEDGKWRISGLED